MNEYNRCSLSISMNPKALERCVELLNTGLLKDGMLDEDSVQALAIGRALDELDVLGQSATEAAIEEFLNLQSTGFAEAQIADMMGERWDLLVGLEEKALHLLPEAKAVQTALYRRRCQGRRRWQH